MKKLLGILMASAMTLSLVLPAEAAKRRAVVRGPAPQPVEYIGPFRIGNPNVFWSGVVAGGASTGAYFAIRKHRALKVAGDGARFSTGAFALTTVGCMALSPMLAAAVVWNTERRYLTQREAMGLGAGCIIPLIGPLVIDAAFDAHPEWEQNAR